jgi:hypothetical protein
MKSLASLFSKISASRSCSSSTSTPRSFICQDEVIMVLLGLLDPDHVIEEQVLTIARRQTLMCEAGTAHHYSAQPADLRNGHRSYPYPASTNFACMNALTRTRYCSPSSKFARTIHALFLGTERSKLPRDSPLRGCRGRNPESAGPRTRVPGDNLSRAHRYPRSVRRA